MRNEQEQQIEDAELVRRCRTSDEAAFNMLYQRYRLPLFSYMNRLLPDLPAEVDDLFQQTWVKAISNWDKYDERQRFFAWLCRIAHNLVMDQFRARSRCRFEELSDVHFAEELPAGTAQDQELLAQKLERAIAALPQEQRDVVLLRREGVSFKEIAERKNAKLNTVLGRMHDAVLKLREELSMFL